MNQILKGISGVVLSILIVVLGFLVYGNYQQHKLREQEEILKQQEETQVIPQKNEEEEAKEPEEVIEEPKAPIDVKLAACGDLVIHTGLHADAEKEDGSYDYFDILSGSYNAVSNADFAFCTMETTFSPNGEISGYPMFKTPWDFAKSLKKIGFDLINTANNHSLDSLKAGLDNTLNVLDEVGLEHVGTYRTQEERDAQNGIVVKDINGISFAILSFTYGTNGMPATDYPYAVNIFFKDYLNNNMSNINYELLKEDMAAARALNTDMILVIPHWGYEYQTKQDKYQEELADFFFAEGADIVIGGHPHVPQPMELRLVTDNQGNEKTCLLAYCLGNYLSTMNDRYTDLHVSLNIDVQKDTQTGETYLNHVSYTPMYMADLGDFGISNSWRYRLLDLYAAKEAYEGGDNLGFINESLYNDLCKALDDTHSILDESFDYKNGGVDVIEWSAQAK